MKQNIRFFFSIKKLFYIIPKALVYLAKLDKARISYSFACTQIKIEPKFDKIIQLH